MKTLAAVGGWSFASSKFSAMADDPVMRNNFVTSAVAFLRQHGFDGLDLDWEYPGLRGGSAKDRDNFVLLCKVKYIYYTHSVRIFAPVEKSKYSNTPVLIFSGTRHTSLRNRER